MSSLCSLRTCLGVLGGVQALRDAHGDVWGPGCQNTVGGCPGQVSVESGGSGFWSVEFVHGLGCGVRAVVIFLLRSLGFRVEG